MKAQKRRRKNVAITFELGILTGEELRVYLLCD
jgi:hypothetical protein